MGVFRVCGERFVVGAGWGAWRLGEVAGCDEASVVVPIKATIALKLASREHPNDPLFQG